MNMLEPLRVIDARFVDSLQGTKLLLQSDDKVHWAVLALSKLDPCLIVDKLRLRRFYRG